MRHKTKKTAEQRTAEEYFPVDKNDLKYAVEKSYKPQKNSVEKIESTLKPRKKRKISRKSKKREYSPPKIKLKKEGYELIITEKPQAALKISSALGNSIKKNISRVPYYEVNRNGQKIIVACAVGHLFTLSQNNPGTEVPTFDISWVPNYLVRKKDFTKQYYNTILKLVKDAGKITIATDYDIEGEVIGLNIVRFICGQKDASRMKFSTLTKQELDKSYKNKSLNVNWGQAIAGETRHYLDWFYGINLSRALMNAIKTTGKFKIMSIGRVQGPTLDLIVKKEQQIKEFISQDYWQVFIKIKNSHNLELKYNKDIFKKSELTKFDDLKGKIVEVHTKITEKIIPPNTPFDLTTLQIEAYRLYGITPSRTLRIAQSLYLSGLISYPRTSSQKLPDSIGYKEILNKLIKKYKAEKLVIRTKPIEGKKTDSAHPSIYPTGNFQILSRDDEKIYNLIVKRFICLFCDNAIISDKNISTEINQLKFSTRGSSIRKKAWMEIYPSKLIEKEIPDFNGEAKIINLRTEQKKTQPPKRYSPASIISHLEKKNLGTKATRAAIIETLYDRGYIKEKSIQATPLGISLIETLEKHSPIIIDEKLTRTFEKEIESISQSQKNLQNKEIFIKKEEEIIKKAKETIKKISYQFKKEEKNIGKELMKANAHLIEQQKQENTLNICPICKKGSLAITYSKKNRRHFIACNAYPNCKTTYSLPPNGIIKKTGKNCEKCGFPILMRLSKGKKPWIFCFNSQCPANKKRIEEYRKKKEIEVKQFNHNNS